MRLRFGEVLRSRGWSTIRFIEASGLPSSTVYNLVRDDGYRRRVDLVVLTAALEQLQTLTGKPVTLDEVFDYSPIADQAPLALGLTERAA